MSSFKKFGFSGGMFSSAPKLYHEKFDEFLDLMKSPAYTKSAPVNRVIPRHYISSEHEETERRNFKFNKKQN
jgi:hypothetical protein